ncbi:MAG: hypothetical protein EOP22_16775 [Hyphomicrobiales bacterium]|nr:MAG: hypothetical protein EOP22_16775 [Hyphomicrobiales bacterium]
MDADFYLASQDGYRLQQPRACWRLKPLSSPNAAELLLVQIDPPLIGQPFGLGGDDIHQLILAPKYVGQSLTPITQWPAPIHVSRYLGPPGTIPDLLPANAIELIAWAELHPTRPAAEGGNPG